MDKTIIKQILYLHILMMGYDVVLEIITLDSCRILQFFDLVEYQFLMQ